MIGELKSTSIVLIHSNNIDTVSDIENAHILLVIIIISSTAVITVLILLIVMVLYFWNRMNRKAGIMCVIYMIIVL